MSQCYQVQLKQSVSRRVDQDDSVSYPIELTEILPQDEMKDILRGVLESDGWMAEPENSDRFRKTGAAGETLELDLGSMEVTATISDEKEVSADVSATGIGERRSDAKRDANRQLQQQAAAKGDQIEEAARRVLRDELREKLAESEDDRMRQLNELLQKVYAESLKRKAGQLGDIMEVHESTGEDDNYELVIRVAQ
ncbi:MAG: hypothetical protein AAF585_25605 [Verrucomicrobiota bacterium]